MKTENRIKSESIKTMVLRCGHKKMEHMLPRVCIYSSSGKGLDKMKIIIYGLCILFLKNSLA